MKFFKFHYWFEKSYFKFNTIQVISQIREFNKRNNSISTIRLKFSKLVMIKNQLLQLQKF